MRTPQQIEALVPVSDRSAQRFPRLRPEQLTVVKRFAEEPARRFAPDESIFQVGHHGVSTWFLLEGPVELFSRDGFDDETSLRVLASGQFTGELNELANRPSLTGAKAGPEGCVALPLNASRLRALIVGSAEAR
jgi:thioredoxin reductase (NADPH)